MTNHTLLTLVIGGWLLTVMMLLALLVSLRPGNGWIALIFVGLVWCPVIAAMAFRNDSSIFEQDTQNESDITG